MKNDIKYSIDSTWVDEIRLDRTDEETENKNQYSLNVGCAMDYNTTDMKSVRFVMDFSLHSSSKFKLSGVHYTIIKFSSPLTGDEAEEEMRRINAPSLIYPYIRSFATNILSSAGFPSEHLPLVVFGED